MKRILRLVLSFFLIISAFLLGACSWIQQADTPVSSIYPTLTAASYLQPTSTSLPTSTQTSIPYTAPIPTLTTTPLPPLLPRLPSGDYIVISKRFAECGLVGSDCTDLYVFTPDGEEVGILYSGDYVVNLASLSPIGNEIAFLDPPGYSGDSYSSLVVVDLMTLEKTEIYSTLQRAFGYVVWSPDGLTFLIELDGNIELLGVNVPEKKVILYCGEIWDDHRVGDCGPLAWSLDSQWILFNVVFDYSGSQDPREGTYIMPAGCINQSNACPSQVRKISDIISIDASWSPAGDMIAIGDYQGKIFIYHPESDRLTQLVDIKKRINSLSWSPDGKFLAYTTDSIVGVITIQTSQVEEIDVPGLGEYVNVPFWLHRRSTGN